MRSFTRKIVFINIPSYLRALKGFSAIDTCGRIISELGSLYGFGVQIGAAGNKLVSYMAAKITR